MTRTSLLLALLTAFALLLPLSGPAEALTCTASIQDANFGSVTVRDGGADQTSANVTFDCSGGTANASVQACLALGAGSGGAAANYSPRYMQRSDGTTLGYALKSGSQSGAVWDSVTTTATLDGNGAASFQTVIYAEVTSTGYDVKGGSYSSSFAGSTSFSFGEGNCGSTSADPSFTVLATVSPSCTLTVSPMDFGTISSFAQPVDTAATVSASCTNAVTYSISMGPGGNYSGTRRMKQGGGSGYLPYGLYQDAGRTAAWGDGTNGSGNPVTGTGNGSQQNIQVYGRVPKPSPLPPAGSYADTVVVTITY